MQAPGWAGAGAAQGARPEPPLDYPFKPKINRHSREIAARMLPSDR